MKNLQTKKKFRTVLIAAFVGSALFVMLTIGAFANYFSLGNEILIMIPTVFLRQSLGLNQSSMDSFLTIVVSPYIINGLLGAFIFGIVTAIWQFLLKGDNEK